MLLLVALAALDRPLLHLFVASFAGLVGPVLAQTGNLSAFVAFMAGGAAFLQLDGEGFGVRKGNVAILGRQTDDVTGSKGERSGADDEQNS